MKIRFGLIVLLLLGGIACEQKVETMESPTTPATAPKACLENGPGCEQTAQDATPAPKAPAAPKEPTVSCQDMGIPSWEGTVSELTDFRCARCHNERFAWNGVLLTTYANLVANKAGARARIQKNALTEPLDPIEQGTFLAFFEAGMPEKETDCASLQKTP